MFYDCLHDMICSFPPPAEQDAPECPIGTQKVKDIKISRFDEKIVEKVCNVQEPGISENVLPPGMVNKFQRHLKNTPGLLWQYTGDFKGLYYQYPAAAWQCGKAKSDFRFK